MHCEAYGSCRVSEQGTTLRASDLHNARATILNPFNNVPELFNSYFRCDSDNHNYNTRSAQSFDIPQIKAALAKAGWHYVRSIFRNAVLNHNMYPDVPECI